MLPIAGACLALALAHRTFALPPQPFPAAPGAAAARSRVVVPVEGPLLPVVYQQKPRGGGPVLDEHGS